ncbi:hypothetical protein [Streptomyces noursei]|uniref:hypothetical protein n=1 Tax=Streptomyces noursei TaxID=1971 RepID=UPI0016778A1A|nr:hypothetical protein [Streptomyces noursei]MCZ1019839.1 hypothetical protein [Streptomyces noursei]GGX36311.1 hypothetical protein GCM10010341_67210 [Streptomyces noursei]
MPAITNYTHDTQHTAHDNDLYEALIMERYGRPLHEILWEETRHPLPELLKERQRRPRLPATTTARHQPHPDPDAAAHRAVLLEAITPHRRRTA